VTDKPTIVVEVRGPQRSGVTTLAQVLTHWLRSQYGRGPVDSPSDDRRNCDRLSAIEALASRVEVREATPDDRDRELASLRQERDRLRADVERLQRRQIPPSWSSPDGTEWSGISGDGVLDVRGSKKDIDVVAGWRHAKDRLAWFEEEYRRSQAREASAERVDEDRRRSLDLALHHEEAGSHHDSVPSWDELAEMARHSRERGDRSAVQDTVEDGVVYVGSVRYVLAEKFVRLLTAFHDATRRPLGVTPDSGLEFYDARMADEAEARRTRHGRGPK